MDICCRQFKNWWLFCFPIVETVQFVYL